MKVSIGYRTRLTSRSGPPSSQKPHTGPSPLNETGYPLLKLSLLFPSQSMPSIHSPFFSIREVNHFG